jgi:hypothetical protein
MAQKHKVNLLDFYRILSKQHVKKTIYIEFLKKSDNSLRKMTFQLAGTKSDNGDPLPIHRVLEDVAHQTLTVWDLNKDQYRRLNLSSVKRMVIDQDEYTITP